MHCASRHCATRQGHINGAGFGSAGGFGCAQRLFLPIKRLTNGFFQLIDGLKKSNIEIDRRVLAELALNEEAAFAALAEKAKEALAAA